MFTCVGIAWELRGNSSTSFSFKLYIYFILTTQNNVNSSKSRKMFHVNSLSKTSEHRIGTITEV